MDQISKFEYLFIIFLHNLSLKKPCLCYIPNWDVLKSLLLGLLIKIWLKMNIKGLNIKSSKKPK